MSKALARKREENNSNAPCQRRQVEKPHLRIFFTILFSGGFELRKRREKKSVDVGDVGVGVDGKRKSHTQKKQSSVSLSLSFLSHQPIMFAAFGFGGGGSTFSATYRVYPVSFLEKESAERGDKLILPPSALDRLGAFCSFLFSFLLPPWKKIASFFLW